MSSSDHPVQSHDEPHVSHLRPTHRTTNLSGGSAAFIIIALILGNLAEPAGSLVVLSLLGSWRLSPLLYGLEGLIILVALLHAPFAGITTRRIIHHSSETDDCYTQGAEAAC